jgi:transposase
MSDKERPTEACIVIEVPLRVNEKQASLLNARFNSSRVFYNSCLRECERRRKLHLSHPDHVEAKRIFIELKEKEKQLKDKKITKGSYDFKKNKEFCNHLYNKIQRETGFYLRSSAANDMTNSLEQWVSKVRNGTNIEKELDSSTCLTLMDRAFKSSQKISKSRWVFDKKQNKYVKPSVRFKGIKDPILSISGKNQKSSLRFLLQSKTIRVPHVIWTIDKKAVWPILDLDPIDAYHNFLLKNYHTVGHIKLCRKEIKGKWVYSMQATCRIDSMSDFVLGVKKRELGQGLCGVDIGSSDFALSAPDHAEITMLYPELDLEAEKKLKRLQKRESRMMRQNNPNNFEPDSWVKNNNGRPIKKLGAHKKGCKKIISKRHRKVLIQINEIQRKLREGRKISHSEAANRLRSKADVLRLEDLNYSSWQKGGLGKSSQRRSPGIFSRTLEQTFEKTGGRVEKIDPFRACLSQICPNCGDKKKKERSEDWHKCKKCGYGQKFPVQRDLNSALLACTVNLKTQTVDVEEAKKLLRDRGPILRTTSAAFKKGAKN